MKEAKGVSSNRSNPSKARAEHQAEAVDYITKPLCTNRTSHEKAFGMTVSISSGPANHSKRSDSATKELVIERLEASVFATSSLLGEPASWVIRDRETGEVICETFNRFVKDHLGPRYEAVPILEYLQGLNREVEL